MFKLQLRGELLGSVSGVRRADPINPAAAVLALIEERKGYGQFRVVLPDHVFWSERTALLYGMPGTRRHSLDEVIKTYVAEDRKLVVDTFTRAIEDMSGFGYIARIETPMGRKTVESIGDLIVEDGKVTGAFGLIRDIGQRVEREALGISRALLIRHLIEDIPVPIVVLDRALRVVACSAEWAHSSGVADRAAAIGEPLGKFVQLSRDGSAAIIEAMNGRSATTTIRMFAADDGRPFEARCAMIPWQCGSDRAGGVLMVTGTDDTAFTSLEIADRALGRQTRGLLDMLETL